MLKCKTCIYRKKDMKKFLFYCKKRHIRVGERRKSCELYEPKQKGVVAATPKQNANHQPRRLIVCHSSDE